MQLTKDDIRFFNTLYRMRCLSLKQAADFFYMYPSSARLLEEKISPLIKKDYLSFRTHRTRGAVLFPTVKMLRFLSEFFKKPCETYDYRTGKVKKTLPDLKDILIEDRYISHQLALNDFVLEFFAQSKSIEELPKIEYFDEKFLSSLKHIRPDGSLRVGDHLDIFLEQDMSTESAKQLRDKWNKYRRFLTYEFGQKRELIVCFIVEGDAKSIDGRKELIRRTIGDIMDTLLSDRFDVFIGTKDELLDVLFKKVLAKDSFSDALEKAMKKQGWRVGDGRSMRMILNGSAYRYYTCKTNDQGALYHYAGRASEFLMDEYRYAPVSVLSKITFHEKNSHNFDIAYSKVINKRLIGYVIVVDDIKMIFKHLRTMDLIGTNNVYFTTLPRLLRMPLEEAIFTFRNDDGDIYHCADASYVPSIYEGNIRSYRANGLKI